MNDSQQSFPDYCPKCTHFEIQTGVCKILSENVRDYPRKFAKKCNGKYFVLDATRIVAEIEDPEEPEYSQQTVPTEKDLVNDSKLVTVYIPNNEAEHLAVVGILSSAGIPCYSKNAGVQNLFGAGQIGTGFNILTGPIQIQVAENAVENAKEIISNVLSDQKDFAVSEIPAICPACDSATKGLPQCPDCGLVFSFGSDNIESETTASASISAEVQEIVTRQVNKSMLFSIFWLGGIGSILGIYYGWQSLKRIREAEEEIKGKGKAILGIIFGILGLLVWISYWYGLTTKLGYL